MVGVIEEFSSCGVKGGRARVMGLEVVHMCFMNCHRVGHDLIAFLEI